MKATVAALWALVIVHLARGAFSQINSTQLDQDDDLVPAARLPRSVTCGLDDPEFDGSSCDSVTNQNYGCTQGHCWRSEPGVERLWCFPVFGKLQSGGRSEKIEEARCWKNTKGEYTISPGRYDCLRVARMSLERGQEFDKNGVAHTYYTCSDCTFNKQRTKCIKK